MAFVFAVFHSSLHRRPDHRSAGNCHDPSGRCHRPRQCPGRGGYDACTASKHIGEGHGVEIRKASLTHRAVGNRMDTLARYGIRQHSNRDTAVRRTVSPTCRGHNARPSVQRETRRCRSRLQDPGNPSHADRPSDGPTHEPCYGRARNGDEPTFS